MHVFWVSCHRLEWLSSFKPSELVEVANTSEKQEASLESLSEYLLPGVILCPFVSAALAGVFRRSRLAALVSLIVSTLLTSATACAFRAGLEQDILLEWVRLGLGVDLSFEVSAASLAGVLAVLGFAWIAWRMRQPDREDRRSYYALLLLVQGALTSILLAGDLLLALAFCPPLIFCGMMLTALWGPHKASKIELRPFMGPYVGWLVLLAAALHLGWLHYQATGLLSFSLQDLLTFAPPANEWAGLWILIFVGALGAFALGPATWLFLGRSLVMPPGAYLLWLCGGRVAGAVFLIRILGPLVPAGSQDALVRTSVFLGISAAGLVAWSLATSANRARTYLPLLALVPVETALLIGLILGGEGFAPWFLGLIGLESALSAILLLRSTNARSDPGGLASNFSPRQALLLLPILLVLALVLFSGPLTLGRTPRSSASTPAFVLSRQPKAGLLSAIGATLWAVGLFSMRPFGHGRPNTGHELLSRFWGQAIVQVGVAMFLLDGITPSTGPSGAYARAAWFADPLRVATMVAAHTLLVLLLTGATVGLLALRGRSVRSLEDLTGLARSCPGEAGVLMLTGLSLLGIAPLAGYWVLCLLFGLRGSWHSEAMLGLPLLFVLPVAGMSIMDLSARMYQRGQGPEVPLPPADGPRAFLLRIGIAVLLAALVILGLVPQILLEPVGWLGS